MKKILSIDSGGVRGIIPAIILAELERRVNRPICELFDFFAGTSTGGMLVLGLNRPNPFSGGQPFCSAVELAMLFHEWGPRVFGHRLSRDGQPANQSTSEERMEAMLRDYFGNSRLSDCIKPTMVTAFDLIAAQPVFIHSATRSDCGSRDVFMWQAARATTAVHTHFEPFRISAQLSSFGGARDVSLVDGSLFASNPAMCALAEARSLFPDEDDFVLVSLGCGEVHSVLSFDSTQKRRRVLDFSLKAQSDSVDHQMRTFLSKQHYIRIQTPLPAECARIDDASRQNMLAIEKLSEEAILRSTDELDRVVHLLQRSLKDRTELAAA
jgi:patatin-like phospholipase/acyl hydrolase